MASLVDIPVLKKDYREVGIVLTAVAALLFVIASLTHGWLHNPVFGIKMSLLSTEACVPGGDTCESMSHFKLVDLAKDQAADLDRYAEMANELGKRDPFNAYSTHNRDEVSGTFPWMGILTLILALVSAIAMFITAWFGAMKKRAEWPVSPVNVALSGLMLGLVTGCIFLATKPGGQQGVGVGYSFWMFAIGTMMGIVGVQILNKLVKPAEKAWTA